MSYAERYLKENFGLDARFASARRYQGKMHSRMINGNRAYS